MEVLNKRERLLSFLLFLLLFIITIFIINGAIYFDYYLPWKENAELKDRNELLEQELKFQKDFTVQLEQVKVYIDSINTSNQDFRYYQQNAYTVIAEMEQSISQEKQFLQESMYNNIIFITKQLVDAKGALYDLEQSKERIEQLQQKLDAYREQFDKAIRDLDEARKLNKDTYGEGG